MKLLLVFILCIGVKKSTAQYLPLKDSIKVISIINDWNQGWKVKDYVLATKGYSQDAYFTNAFGDKRNGQKQIETLLREVFNLPFVMAGSSETTAHHFQVPDGNQVIVHTAVVRKGQRMPDGIVLPDRQTTHLRVFQKEADEWKIIAHLISDARDKQTVKH